MNINLPTSLPQDAQFFERIIGTVILLAAFLLIRQLSVRGIRNWKTTNADLKRRWIVQVKNLTFALFALGILIIWATQLRSFALSIVAIAAALAISLKEMILCLMGGLYKASARSFEIGDRIEVNDCRGDVIDHDFVSTTILEIGPGKDMHQYTGRQIVLPNSLFLSHAIFNETSKSKYVLHVFKIPLMAYDDWKKAEQILVESSNEVCAPYMKEAKVFFSQMGQMEGIEPPNPEPRVSIKFAEADELHLMVRVVAQPNRTGTIEQAIIKKYLSKMPQLPAKTE